jgi:multiple sugar transport system permease protein
MNFLTYLKHVKIGRLCSYIGLLGAVLVSLFPVFWTLSTSVKTRVSTFSIPPQFFDFTPTFKNYVQLFSSDEFLYVFMNTMLITFFSTFLCVIVSTLTAYALARSKQFPSRVSLEISLLLVRAIPTIVLMVPLFQIVSVLNLYDNRVAMIILYAAVNLPFAVWLMTSFVEQIPVELEECASVDGASGFQILSKIIFPLAAPGMAATMIFVALLAWNEFLIPVLLAGETAKTLPVYISGFISARNLDWGPMAAASSLAIVPIAFFTVIIQRRLVSGLSSGAVKG